MRANATSFCEKPSAMSTTMSTMPSATAQSEPTPSHRRGKIARLSRAVRDQLNIRLDDGQEAAEILPWLNDLPEVRQIISERFNGSPVSPQNLSAWRQGGFQEWLLHRELLDSAAHMREHVAELREEIASDSPDGIPHPLTDYMVATLTVRFAGFLGRWNGEPGDVQLATLLKVGQFILRLQQAAYRAEKEALERRKARDLAQFQEAERRDMLAAWPVFCAQMEAREKEARNRKPPVRARRAAAQSSPVKVNQGSPSTEPHAESTQSTHHPSHTSHKSHPPAAPQNQPLTSPAKSLPDQAQAKHLAEKS